MAGGRTTGRHRVKLSCHCGGVTLALPRAPDEITHCNCSVCTKTGFRGIYYRAGEVEASGKVDSYVRSDIEACLTLWHCPTCGVITHWTGLDNHESDRMGVNGRLLDPDVVTTLPVREVDGASW